MGDITGGVGGTGGHAQIGGEGGDGDGPQLDIDPDDRYQIGNVSANVLYFALKTLSSISNNVPMAGALSGIIEPLLDITSRIEQSSVNAQGLIQLATRIEHLAPLVEETAKSDPDRGRWIVLELQTELASMTTDLKAASQRGKLNQFFNNADDASPLSKHNMVLAQLIADSKLVGIQEVLESLRELESSKMEDASSPIVMGDITGGVGGTGGHAQIGGEGGEGDGPQLDIDPDDRYQIGNVSGGTGGAGGVGIEVGGKGGTGKGPVISMRQPAGSLKF
ncbi:hypothetical protein K438DRAFT_1865891 [Mycena galopus ATCC 62051]|nr:hypothetical protein K438DRAFT_1865891 [Mycena galopus ATCC 62051]